MIVPVGGSPKDVGLISELLATVSGEGTGDGVRSVKICVSRVTGMSVRTSGRGNVACAVLIPDCLLSP